MQRQLLSKGAFKVKFKFVGTDPKAGGEKVKFKGTILSTPCLAHVPSSLSKGAFKVKFKFVGIDPKTGGEIPLFGLMWASAPTC